jgi:MoaA/NifB/PqqE/SkfB family radical SAM enzyme
MMFWGILQMYRSGGIMNLGNVIGALNLTRQRPQLIRPFTDHVRYRLTHPLTKHRNGLVHAPENITFVVTDRCNLRCKMCQYAYSDAPGYQLNQVGHMEPDLFYKIIDELAGRPMISFTGGEPLLHPQIAEFIAAAKNKGLLTTLTTNGWLLARQAEALCQAGLDVLVVSVDGPEAVHNMIRGGKSFSRLAEGIQAVRHQKKRPVLLINTTISNLNHDQLITVYEQAKDWGVDGLNFNHLWMQTEEMIERLHEEFPHFAADEVAWQIEPEAVDVTQLADQLETIRRQNQSERFLVTELPKLNRRQIAAWYQQPAEFVKYHSTRCAWTRMKIWPDGRIKPCREWVAGSAAEQPLMDVWHSQAFQEFRSLLAEHGTIPICSRCCYTTYR